MKKTITQLEKEFKSEINKYFKIDYCIYGGTYSGKGKIMGRHISLTYSARMILAYEYIQELKAIVERYYGATERVVHLPNEVFTVSKPEADELRQVTFEFVDQSE